MPSSYDWETRWPRIQMLALGLVSGALAVGLIWLVNWWFTTEPDGSRPVSHSTAPREPGDRTEMTPQEATDLWLRTWHRGDRQVTALRAAAHDAAGLRC